MTGTDKIIPLFFSLSVLISTSGAMANTCPPLTEEEQQNIQCQYSETLGVKDNLGRLDFNKPKAYHCFHNFKEHKTVSLYDLINQVRGGGIEITITKQYDNCEYERKDGAMHFLMYRPAR